MSMQGTRRRRDVGVTEVERTRAGVGERAAEMTAAAMLRGSGGRETEARATDAGAEFAKGAIVPVWQFRAKSYASVWGGAV